MLLRHGWEGGGGGGRAGKAWGMVVLSLKSSGGEEGKTGIAWEGGRAEKEKCLIHLLLYYKKEKNRGKGEGWGW